MHKIGSQTILEKFSEVGDLKDLVCSDELQSAGQLRGDGLWQRAVWQAATRVDLDRLEGVHGGLGEAILQREREWRGSDRAGQSSNGDEGLHVDGRREWRLDGGRERTRTS